MEIHCFDSCGAASVGASMSNRTNLVSDFLRLDARPVPGFDGYYATSDGRVFSVCEMKRFLHNDGYYRITTFAKRLRRRAGVHTLVALAFVGEPPPGKRLVCRHLDGNRQNNRPDNLAWGTVKENGEDASRHGTLKGSRNPTARLTEDDVREIRRRWPGETQKALGEAFGVSKATIEAVTSRRNWKHVT